MNRKKRIKTGRKKKEKNLNGTFPKPEGPSYMVSPIAPAGVHVYWTASAICAEYELP